MAIILERLVVSGRFNTNCYLYGDEISKEVCIIDPGIHPNDVIHLVNREGYKPVYLIGTHPHHDHIQSAFDIMDYFNIPLLINNIGLGKAENINLIKEDDIIEIGGESLHVIETPGHTNNDIMLIDYKNKLIFTGDTLLKGRIPRQFENYNNMMASIKKVLFYPKISDEFKIYPGHGAYSTIGKERLEY
jgi:glyoxylase-like metal-dependent hydrolase (beta-lactamase superfamily II)